MSFLGGNAGKRADKRHDKGVRIAYDAAKDDWKYRNESQQLAYNDAVLGNTIQERNLNQQLLWQEHTAQRTWDAEVRQRESEYNSQVAAYNKAERLYGAQIDLNQYARKMAMESAAAVQAERLDAVKFQGMEADLKLSQTKSDIDQQRAGLDLTLIKQRSEIDLQKIGATLQHQQRRAEAAFGSERQLVEMMQAAGNAEAKGQAGRSASKNMQVIMGMCGRAQAQLADQINRADSAYNLTMMGLDKSLIYGEAEYQLQGTALTSKAAYADLAHGLGVQQRDATKDSIRSAYGRALKKAEFDEYGANLAADAKRMSAPGFAPLPPKPLELPRPILKDPMLPRDLPEPRKGAGSMGAGAAQDQAAGVGMVFNAFATLGLAFLCDMRVKHEVALLEYTEVDDVLSKLAFLVKDIREHS